MGLIGWLVIAFWSMAVMVEALRVDSVRLDRKSKAILDWEAANAEEKRLAKENCEGCRFMIQNGRSAANFFAFLGFMLFVFYELLKP